MTGDLPAWHELACAEMKNGYLEGMPHLTLACGCLSQRGNGPLAEAGYGYCAAHGVQEITEAATAAGEGNGNGH
jgi:hypothetical protein